MTRNPIPVILVMSLLFSSGCAAKNRWFSRRDYSEMQDPFIQSEAVASEDGTGNGSTDSPGRVRMNGLTADSEGASKQPIASGLAGPKPLQQPGAPESAARTGRIATASYPKETDAAQVQPKEKTSEVRSYTGPALSDFLNRKRAEPATADPATDFASLPKTSLPNAATASPSADPVAAAPELSDAAEGFVGFLEQKQASATDTAHRPAETVQQAEESVPDISQWAEQKKTVWSQEGSAASSAAPNPLKNQLDSAAQPEKFSNGPGDPSEFDFSDSDFGAEESAEPLILKADARPSLPAPDGNSAPVFEDAKTPVATAEENSFENPFDFDSAPPAMKPVPPTSSKPVRKQETPRKSLDDSFQMDNGWKPAHMVHP